MIRVLHTESSFELGGQELRIVNKLLALKNKGFSVGLVASNQSEIYKLAKKKSIPLYNLTLKKRKLSTLLKLKKIVIENKVDILHTHSSRDSWYGAFIKLICPKIKLVRTRHISTKISNDPFTKFLYRIPDFIITTGEKVRKQMIVYNKIDANKILSIPTGVDLSKFDPKNVIPSLEKNHIFLLGTISILRSWKGHTYLLEAISKVVKKIDNIKCVIIGDGPQRDNLSKLVNDLNIQNYVEFLGYRKDIPSILASLDLLVHPSIAHEGLPQVILQALAMEKPVIATDVGSVSEVIKNNFTGILIEPCNSDQLAKAILTIIQSPDKGKNLGKEGRKLVEKSYSFDYMIEQIMRVYYKLISPNSLS